MSVWLLPWHWVGWICPAPHELPSLPSACLLPAADSSLAPYQPVYLVRLWINRICTLFAPEVQTLLLGFLTTMSQSCKGQMQHNHLSSLGWGTLCQGLFIPLPRFWHHRLFNLPPCLWHVKWICMWVAGQSFHVGENLSERAAADKHECIVNWKNTVDRTSSPLLLASTDTDNTISKIYFFLVTYTPSF